MRVALQSPIVALPVAPPPPPPSAPPPPPPIALTPAKKAARVKVLLEEIVDLFIS